MTQKTPENISACDALTFINDNIEAFAVAKARRVALENFSKVQKSLSMQVAAGLGAKTIVQQERDAYASEEYRAHLNALEIATSNEERLRWRLDSAKMEIEVWRSLNADKRTVTR